MRRRTFVALVAAAVLLPVAKVSAELPPLRVLSYNIHHGEGVDEQLDLPRIARVIRSAQPDLVALQEVDINVPRTKGVDQAAELARLTEMQVVFGKAMDYCGGQYGVAVLSRFPILESTNHPLPLRQDHEPRTSLVTHIRLGEGGPTVRFVCTHLDHRSDDFRIEQVRGLDQFLRDQEPLPTILAGDLNATPESRPLGLLLAHWALAGQGNESTAAKSEDRRRAIDHVLLRAPDDWRVVETQLLDEPIASDHRPWLVVVQLAKEK
jgi:endonuclease/exonuclease/phosphatase family metal-dependent hydrolase